MLVAQMTDSLLLLQRLERTAQRARSVSPAPNLRSGSPTPSLVNPNAPQAKKSVDDVLGRWDKKARVYSNEAAKDTDKRALAVFSKYDTEGKGIISKQNVAQALRDLGIEAGDQETTAAFEKIGVKDTDRIDLSCFIQTAETFKTGIAGKVREQTIAESLWELVMLALQKTPSIIAKMVNPPGQEDNAWMKELSQGMTGKNDPSSKNSPQSGRTEDEKGNDSPK
jgi:hypothetical protein